MLSKSEWLLPQPARQNRLFSGAAPTIDIPRLRSGGNRSAKDLLCNRVAAAAGLLVCLASLGLLAADSSIPTPSSLRAWLAQHDFISDGRLEWQARDEAVAVSLYSRLLQRDPANPYRWCDLADAYQDAGRTAPARTAFERAARLGPAIPPVLIRAANFSFSTGDFPAAIPLYRRVLAMVHDYDAIVFLLLHRMGLPPGDILANLPPNPETARNYLEFLLRSGSEADLSAAWSWMSSRRLASDRTTGSYIEYLLVRNQVSRAAKVWSEHTAQTKQPYEAANQIYNPSFEFAFKPSRFDWRIQNAPGVEVSIDSEDHQRGTHCLKIRFTGESNIDFHHVDQLLSLAPGRYRFQARVRCQGLTSRSGIRFHLFDPSERRFDWQSLSILDSQPWSTIQADVAIPKARYLVLEIMRLPSPKFDNHIAGSVWIDDVSLVRIETAPPTRLEPASPREPVS